MPDRAAYNPPPYFGRPRYDRGPGIRYGGGLRSDVPMLYHTRGVWIVVGVSPLNEEVIVSVHLTCEQAYLAQDDGDKQGVMFLPFDYTLQEGQKWWGEILDEETAARLDVHRYRMGLEDYSKTDVAHFRLRITNDPICQIDDDDIIDYNMIQVEEAHGRNRCIECLSAMSRRDLQGDDED